MPLMTIIRGVYTILMLVVLLALLVGPNDRPTNLFISLASLLIIALVSWWSWLRERRDRPSK